MSQEIHGPEIDSTDQAGGRRLDSWKEIAAFFQRDTRTVRRWEQTRHLPVRRVPGRRGYVFAYVDELNQWLHSADAAAAKEESSLLEADEPEPDDPTPSPLPLETPTPPTHRLRTFAVTAAFIVLAVVAFAAARHRHHPDPSPTSTISPSDLSESAKFTLRGKYYWERRTDGGLQQALDAFTQAVVHDNNNARAYAGLAETYDLLPEYGKMRDSDAFPRAIAAANRAISLDPSLAEAHRALAFALFYWNWDVHRALAEFHTALQLDPLDFETHHWLATTLLTLGDSAGSRAEIQRARELRPASRSILADQALINISFHTDAAESLTTLREIERSEPDFVPAPRYLSTIAFDQARYADYITEATQAAAVSHDENAAAVMHEAQLGFRKDGPHGMLLRMKPIQEQQFASGQLSGFDVALTLSALGEKPEAVHYLQAAFAAHDFRLLTILGGNLQAQLHDYPPFTQLQADVRQRMSRSN